MKFVRVSNSCKNISKIQFVCIFISIYLTNNSDQKYISWLSLLVPIITVLSCKLSNVSLIERILNIYLSLLPIYILLSLKFEPAFFGTLFLSLFFLFQIERDASKSYSEKGESSSLKSRLYLRLAMLLLLLVYASFFAIGNIASFGSFSLESIYRFTTKFDPFLMGVLLMIKILIPFILSSLTIYTISLSWKIEPIVVYLLAIAFSDLTTIRFFFEIKTEGSWLDMGTSMTQYLIASLFIIVFILLFGISKFILS
eukprot:NODE_588_length_5657_cov_0.948183.p3 type:complete len:255 gc:universal NODE_588_length_5657_cov_0.948183:2010-1246(-)